MDSIWGFIDKNKQTNKHKQTSKIFRPIVPIWHINYIELFGVTADSSKRWKNNSGAFYTWQRWWLMEFMLKLECRQNKIWLVVGDHTVSKFSLTEMWRVRRIGGEGSDNGQFIYPRQLTTDPIGRVFIADYSTNRICIHDPDLNHLRNITHESMSRPYDVKVSRDRLYVLCSANPCMLVLTLEGDKLYSLITCGEGLDVSRPLFFCFDSLNNFVISDYASHSIRVFSPEGKLLHTIGRVGHQPGMFYHPRGVAVTPNRRLVYVSGNENYGLQIFC